VLSDVDPGLLASLLSALAVFTLVLALAPVVLRRRVLAARLEHFVPPVARPQPAPIAPPTPSRLSPSHLVTAFQAWPAAQQLAGVGLVVIGGGVYLLTEDVLLTLSAAILVVVFAMLWGQDMLAARARLIDAQTLPTILRMAASLRAGATLFQAMELIARDGPAPTCQEFAQAVEEVSLGASIDEALARLARRAGTDLYDALALVLIVQRRVGGNLAQVLDDLAETVRERVELRQEVQAQTAQQRLSAWILVLLPLLILGVFAITDAGLLEPLFTTLTGRILVLGGSLMLAIGAWALRRASRIEL
jgi:tight adherence protein B